MIRRILIVGQGPNDVGFLIGFCDRLGCHAVVVDYLSGQPLLRQRGQFSRKQDAKLIWDKHRNVDLIVRLADGDTQRPQNTKREETAHWPKEADPFLVIGVCDRDIEHWVCLDPEYAGDRLGFDPALLPKERKERSGFIKGRIKASLRMDQDYSGFLADYVKTAPPGTLKRWLANPAFSAFYDDCRAAAMRHDCEVTNLRDAGEAR